MIGDEIEDDLDKIYPFLLSLAENNENILEIVIILSQKCDIQPYISETLKFTIQKAKSI